jgi:ribosomal protein S18 acetylase RimI-like enzyme
MRNRCLDSVSGIGVDFVPALLARYSTASAAWPSSPCRIPPMPPPQLPNLAQLDNTIWHALHGPHRSLAAFAGEVGWYPPEVAPFVAVRAAECRPDLEAAAARGFRGPAYFVGVIPESLPDGWDFVSRSLIVQMLPPPDEAAAGEAVRSEAASAALPRNAARSDVPPLDEADIRLLEVMDRPAMLALTRAAFPDYFRERTADLGTYLGIFAGGRLVAMAGERLALDGWQEISGVCTHPDFMGRGYARRLTRALMHRHRRRGVRSFLHVSETNLAARRLYESMGFVARANLALAKVACSRLR